MSLASLRSLMKWSGSSATRFHLCIDDSDWSGLSNQPSKTVRKLDLTWCKRLQVQKSAELVLTAAKPNAGVPRGPIDPQVKATRGAVYLLVGERKVNTADLSPMIKESHATRDRIGIASSPGAEPYRYEILKGWSRS